MRVHTSTIHATDLPPVTAESIARAKAAAAAERDLHYRITGDHIDASGRLVRDEPPSTEAS